MRSTFLGRTALASALAIAIGACGDSGSGGPEFDDEATTEQVSDFAEQTIDLTGDLARQFHFGEPNPYLSAVKAFAVARATDRLPARSGSRLGTRSLPALPLDAAGRPQLAAAPGCTITAHGIGEGPFDPYDGNHNDLPDDWGVEQKCVTYDSSDVSNIWTQRSTFRMVAKEDAASLYGFSAEFWYEVVWTSEEGEVEGSSFEAEETLDMRATEGHRNATWVDREWWTGEGESGVWETGAEAEADFDPDGTIVFGQALPDGEISFTGRRWKCETGDESLSFTLETTDPLSMDGTCFTEGPTPPFTDGTLVGRLNGSATSATFTIDFTECGGYEVAIDNASDEPVVVTRRPPVERRTALRGE